MFKFRWPFMMRKRYDEQAERYNKRIVDMMSINDRSAMSARAAQRELDALNEHGLNIIVGPEYGNLLSDDIKVSVHATVSRDLAIDALASPEALLKRVCDETGKMASAELFRYIKASL